LQLFKSANIKACFNTLIWNSCFQDLQGVAGGKTSRGGGTVFCHQDLELPKKTKLNKQAAFY
jgi:hypothetical protein